MSRTSTLEQPEYSYQERPWPKSRLVFSPGENTPKDHASVKGQIYDIVVAHPDGITGEELVEIASKRVRTPRSHHADHGEPEVEWVRRYVTGMTRSTFGFLRADEPTRN